MLFNKKVFVKNHKYLFIHCGIAAFEIETEDT